MLVLAICSGINFCIKGSVAHSLDGFNSDNTVNIVEKLSLEPVLEVFGNVNVADIPHIQRVCKSLKAKSDAIEWLSWTRAHDKNLQSYIFSAVEAKRLNVVASLLDRAQVFIDSVNQGRETLLHKAAASGSLAMVKFLADRKLRINIAAWLGKTPLYLAASNGHLSVIEFLVDHGIIINQEVVFENAPLHGAVINNHLDAVKFLAAQGMGINQVKRNGDTLYIPLLEEGIWV